MRVDRRIAALRRDRAPQQQAQAAMFTAGNAWRADARIAPALAGLEAFGRGAPLSACPALAELFGDGDAGTAFAARLSAVFAPALTGEPFGQLPFRHNFDGAASSLLLARAGTAQLSLLALEPGDYEATSVPFSDATRHDAVLGGAARARRTTRAPDGRLLQGEVALMPGARLAVDLRMQALFVERVERRLVTLRLQRGVPRPGPSRAYSLADGTLLRQAAGDIRQSRHEMMLALLGRMKRTEAAPLMAEMAGEEAPEGLRWQALREALALDTATGFHALCRVARSAGDPLAAPAGALRAQLVEAHPELLALEERQCPA